MAQFRGLSQPISRDLFYYERTDVHEQETVIMDTLGATWMLAWLEESPAPIQIAVQNRWLPLTSNQYLFMPPYSIFKWKLPRGSLRWKAFVSHQLPSHDTLVQSRAMLLPKREGFIPAGIAELWAFVQNQKGVLLETELSLDSELALCLKREIDHSFRDDLLISDLALKMDTSRITLFRHFKGRFGFSPVQYRQRLRLFETIRLVTLGESMTRSVFDSGFSDLSEFSRQFRKVFYTSAADFLGRKSRLG